MAGSDDEFLGAALAAFEGQDEGEQDEPNNDCDLCGLCIKPGEKSKYSKFQLERLHLDCFNGLHCLERMTYKSERLRKHVLTCRTNDVDKFKIISLSLVKPKHKRSLVTRQETMHFVETMIRSTNVKRKTAYLLLPKDQFICWQMFKCRLKEKDAEDKWDEDSTNPSLLQYDEDDQLCVPVKKPTEISSSDKITQEKRLSKTSSTVDKDSGASKLAGKGAMPLSSARDLSDIHGGLFGGLSQNKPGPLRAH
jgi:hypothetical protein